MPTKIGIPVIAYHEITQANLKEQNLATLNELLKEICLAIIQLSGQSGTVGLAADLNLNGHKLLNASNVPGT